MKFFKKYDQFYIDIDVDEVECDFFPYIKWNEVRIRTNINDRNDKNDKCRIMSYQYFKNYIRSIVPENFISSVIDEFDHIYYYYQYNHFITYGYVF